MSRNVKRALVAGALIVGPAVAMATEGGGSGGSLIDATKNAINFIFFLKLLAMAAFYGFGLFYAGTGIMSLVKSLKPNSQENVGVAIGKFFLGVVLCILPTAIGLTANTFQSGAGSTAQGGITTKGDSF